jgi:hypothetical protein
MREIVRTGKPQGIGSRVCYHRILSLFYAVISKRVAKFRLRLE